MRISVNLASRPFVELQPFFRRLRWIMGGLALVALALFILLQVQSRKLAVAESAMDELRQKTAAAQNEKLGNEARMRQPANAAVLDRAHFLNALFLRKSFSWTAVMMDLENVLPTGVQVTAIEPAITADGDVVIRLRVSGDRDRAVQLVRNLEHTTRFIQPKLIGESLHTKEGQGQQGPPAPGAVPGGVEFDIVANYNPLPDTTAVDGPVTAKARKAGDAGGKKQVLRSAQNDNAGTAKKQAAKPGKNDGVVLKPFAPARPAPPATTPKGAAR